MGDGCGCFTGEQGRLFGRKHDSARFQLLISINRPFATIDWRYDVRNGLNGELIATKSLDERPLANWLQELELAWQELLYEVQAECDPSGELDLRR